MAISPHDRCGGTRVLRLFSRLNIGGPSRHVLILTAGLKTRGYETRLVIGKEDPSEGNLLALAQEMGVECLTLPTLGREIRWISDFQALLAIMKLIRDFRPEIIHTHTAKAGALGRLAARLMSVPVVIHTYHGHVLNGYFGPMKTSIYRGIERALAHHTTRLITVSESVKRDLLMYGVGSEDRIRVMPLGLDLTSLAHNLPRGRLRAIHDIASDAPFIGIVGRLAPIKDLATFILAARTVHEALPCARFAVIGDGSERAALEAQSRSFGLRDVVHFFGWMSDMRVVYGDLDVVVNSSRNEGTPVALIEALAAGRPVVATRVGGTPDLLAEGRYGRLVPPRDPEALAQAILATLRAPDEEHERAHAGRTVVLERYSAHRLVDDIDALYRELLERTTKPRAS